jgi:hypothetical protein
MRGQSRAAHTTTRAAARSGARNHRLDLSVGVTVGGATPIKRTRLSVDEPVGWVASICGGKRLLRTLVVALAGGRQRRDGCARAGGRGQARARPASPAGERRWWLPGNALVELEGRGALESRRGLRARIRRQGVTAHRRRVPPRELGDGGGDGLGHRGDCRRENEDVVAASVTHGALAVGLAAWTLLLVPVVPV